MLSTTQWFVGESDNILQKWETAILGTPVAWKHNGSDVLYRFTGP